MTKIVEYAFSELDATDRAWTLDSFHVEDISLFVGRNASGKSRIINTLNGLTTILTRPPEKLWSQVHGELALEMAA